MTMFHTAPRKTMTQTLRVRVPVPQAAMRLTPLAYAVAVLLAAGGTVQQAQAQQAFSGAWFAGKGATQATAVQTGRQPGGVPLAGRPAAPGPQTGEQLQRSLNNLNLAARAIAAQQAAQAQARQAAATAPGVPDGLVNGGLKIDANSLTAGWLNAQAPVQTVQAGKTTVLVRQTADKAILNWETLNVGKDTTLSFQQQKDWAVLNRVNDPLARPSQIQGRIEGDGTVLLVNRNGIVFHGASQVDTRNLVAAAAGMGDAQFRERGIYSNGSVPSISDALGKVDVLRGARLATRAPANSTEGGGYVLLAGAEVHNGGEILAPKGQALLAAGDSFVIRKGVGTDGNALSTTRGNEVVPRFGAAGATGKVANSGLIQVREGDATLAGREVRQDGVLLASTSVNARGTLHLQALGEQAAVVLGQGATTAVLIEEAAGNTALDSQRDGLRAPAVAGAGSMLPLADRRDQSRIAIDSAGMVDFQGASLTLATGGQISVNAAGRSLVRDGAQIDVAGAAGVRLAMESNNVKVNVQGNEQRDAPGNRDGKGLNSSDIWLDRRSLVFVPKGTNGYDSDRWYTAGGLLEVGGYLGMQGHTVGEWMAQGGTLSFDGKDVVTQAGSSINLSGGTLRVEGGSIRQTWVNGADGRQYEASRAPGDLLYTGLYRGFEELHARWGESATASYRSPLIAPLQRLENGYTVGRDAGKLVIGTQAAVLEGVIDASAVQGPGQQQAAQAGVDGYHQSHKAAATRGQLIVGRSVPMFEKSTGLTHDSLGAVMRDVQLAGGADDIAAGLDLGTLLPTSRQGRLVLDTARLNGFELGAIRIAATDTIAVNGAVRVADGGNVTLYGSDVAVNADVTAHAGGIQIGNILRQAVNGRIEDSVLKAPTGGKAGVQVAGGVTFDASGLWSQSLQDEESLPGARLAYRHGGSVSLRSSGDVLLRQDSRIDVRSGAAQLAGGTLRGGKGGNVTLETRMQGSERAASLGFDGALLGQGMEGGGTLQVRAAKVLIGGTARAAADTLQLDSGFFDKGFSRYDIGGNGGLTVADGAQVAVTMPLLRLAGQEVEAWLSPVYREDARKGVLTQRLGASLRLQAGVADVSGGADMASVQARIGHGAVLEVDPGQSITLASVGQLTLDGRLNAWGGKIVLEGMAGDVQAAETANGAGHGRSIWIGDGAVLDAAARAATAVDARGQRYGLVRDGGSIVVGGTLDQATGKADAAHLFVAVREGALLDASGTQAQLDVAGLGATQVASRGGSIALASNNGLYLDGQMKAGAGGAGAAGGTLALALETPQYRDTAGARVRQAREFMLRQQPAGGTLAATQPEQAAAQFAYGHAALAASQVAAGGFGNLSILSNGMLGFDGDLSLSLGQSLHLYAPTLVLADGAAAATRVLLAAPYMRLAGIGAVGAGDGQIRPTVTGGVSTQPAAGTLRLEATQLLDVRDVLTTGAHGGKERAQGLPMVLDRRAFDSVELASQGDLRFLGATVSGQNTVLNTPADLALTAARIYPATGANAIVRAGYLGGGSDYAQQRLLRIGRAGTDGAALPPSSAFGKLTLGAAAIEQGGVLLAPLGGLVLGASTGASMSDTRSLRFLPGSVTSVSGAGLMLPYGGTADGVSWSYDGQDVSLLGAGGTYGTTANLKVGLAMKSRAVDVQPGAVLDLSGGGQLLGAAFVAGRGGSTDARYHPLVQTRANGGFILPELASNPVYAIVPGAQAPVAPADGERGASVPVPGQQVTIGAGVPGLPAGSYTLLPSTYALLPGAFRVEFNGQAGIAPAAPNAMRNGSWAASGRLSVAGTDIGDALSRQLIVTPASVLRSYSQYRETSYADFVRADAARLDVPRAMLEADARTMVVQLMPGNGDAIDFHFQGQARFQPADKGHGGTLAFPMDGGHLEVLAAAGQAGADMGSVSLRAVDVNAVGAARLSLGSLPVVRYGQGGNLLDFATGGAAGAITVRDGASLSAAEVLLIANSTVANQGAGIKVEQGAAISTLGRGRSAFDADDGFVYQPGYRGVLAVSNGRLQMLAPEYDSVGTPASIRIGTCAQVACAATTSLYSEGSIAFATSSAFELGDAVRYGTRHLTLAVGGINVGSAQTLDATAARGALPPGLSLNQEVLDRLLRGDAGTGAPALQTLSLTAAQSLNFYGDTTLSTMDASGKSLLDKLSLTTPAMYGGGKAGEAARIVTDTLVWNGGTAGPAALPGAVLAGGAGTGSGTLDVRARRIEFGYGPDTRPDTLADAQRLILGFADVRLNASERITANHKGSLAVHQSQGAYATGKGYAYAGGDLYLNTPLLTGQAGSVNRITAGGALNIAGAGSGGPAALAGSDALGAELLLAGNSVTLDTAVVLPSGKLTLAATGDVRLLDGAQLDLAGRKVSIHDADKYSWGGEVILTSRSGNIAQAAAAGIDVSARNNQGGKVQAIALDAAAGKVDLQGRLLGGASGRYDAGGTVLPYKGGAVDIRAQDVGDFAALNRRLNDGKVDGERSFQIKQGDLTIGDEIRAGSVNVSLDNGRLTVAGAIDASGERVGAIRLAGKHGVTLAGTAVLDAHGSVLRVDSYGKIIDAPNRAMIEINAGDGVLALDGGARLDVRHGTAAGSGAGKGRHDDQARGTLDLHAARLGSAGGASDADAATHGDIAIAAGAGLRIEGAREIAVHGTARYGDVPQGVLKDANGQVVPGTDGLPQADLAAGGRPYQFIDQAYLDSKHDDSTAFMAGALGNANLLGNKLAGLRTAAYAEALHVRPGVEIVTQGDLVVSGDIDLSAHRYAGLNAKTPKTVVAGSGEPGSLVLRAGGNLDIFGSINDGFAPPPATPDDKGWVLTPGRQAYGGDVVVPGHGVVLAEGTLFPAGKVLNYALPIQPVTLAVGTVLPVAASLAAALEVPVDTVLRADVRDSAGRLLHAAGTLVAGQPLLLPKGTQLGAGSQLSGTVALEGLTWPAGVPLPSLAQFDNYLKPNGVMLASALALRVGALIPADTRVKLPGGALSVPLRAITGGVQGRNWAVAPMLPEGSLSWSMRLVSGADTGAADTRSIRPVLAGDLRLADSHYALYETYDRKIIPGTPARPGGAWFWNALGGELGYEPGTPVAPDLEDWCDAGACDRYNYAWSDSASLFDPAWLAGKPVPLDVEGQCDPDLCIPLGKAIPGTPDRVEIGALKSVTPATQHFSVLRTGTGDLDLIAAGNVSTLSPYGIYTAGTSTASLGNAAYNQARGRAGDGATVLGSGGAAYESLVDGGVASAYAAWYPDHGGNLLLRAGGNLTGDIVSAFGVARQEDLRRQAGSANVGNWLWRQSTGGTAGVDPIPASWWINFGTYIKEAGGASVLQPDQAIIDKLPMLVGFTGMGTLGGGNLSVDVGGHAGMQARRGSADGDQSPRSEGLVLAVAGTGRVGADGGLLLTGGGDMDVRIGGDINPGLQARAAVNNGFGMQLGAATDYQNQNLNLNGALSNLRGALALQTGSLGGVAFNYGGMPQQHDSKEQRAYDPYGATLGTATGGATLMLGDAAARVSTRGDLVLAGTGDPGRVKTAHTSAFTANGKAHAQGGHGWFSLWTDGTAIDLFSAGGSLAPSVQLGDVDFGRTPASQGNHADSDGRFLFPSQLGAVAANGSIFLGKSALGGQDYYAPGYSMLLAPSANGRLDLLAGDSLYASGYAVSRSGAAASSLPTPVHPAFAGYERDVLNGQQVYVAGNGGVDGIVSSLVRFPLFAFGSPSAVPLGDAGTPSRLYAGKGDIVGLRSGEILAFVNGQRAGQMWYEGAAPVWMRAGRDIVNSGTQPGQPTALPNAITNTRENVSGNGVSTGNLFVHARATDVSIVAAGRDILHSSFSVAGPGTLELTAGRHIRMEEQGALVSLGAVVAGDQRPGAGIVLQAGLGEAGVNGVDFAAFAQRYLDPVNLAQAGVPLAQQAGKVARTYAPELAAWLAAREGFSGTPQQARTRFAALPPEQQRIFARQVFFDELKAGGREYNDAQGARFGSYLRGRNAIAALFPAQDAHGARIGYQGDISLYGPSGVNTLFGGDISMLAPGGKQVFGTEGQAPLAVPGLVPGVLTQGAGDIALYAQDSMLLGQSRIMTTFGGAILAWSAQGDINAGRGSKSTIVYTPPKRVYDQWGNVTLASDVPSTGAGIATLAPIPEVPAGDIDLIAPLGTIDAGEAGIRVSGNINLAALQVVNAANIQVQGKSSGMPVLAAVNVAALSNASAAASQATGAAQEVLQRERAAARGSLPSIFSVRVLGFGDEPVEDGDKRGKAASYRPDSPVAILGLGGTGATQRAHLTRPEQQELDL